MIFFLIKNKVEVEVHIINNNILKDKQEDYIKMKIKVFSNNLN